MTNNYSSHGSLQDGGNDFHIADMATIINPLQRQTLPDGKPVTKDINQGYMPKSKKQRPLKQPSSKLLRDVAAAMKLLD